MVQQKALERRSAEPSAETIDYNVYLIRNRDRRLYEHFAHFQPIYGSAARFNPEHPYEHAHERGHVVWITYRTVPRTADGKIPAGYTIVQNLDPHANPDAPSSRYQDLRQLKFNIHFKLEDGIRAARDHIIPGEQGREINQVRAGRQRLYELEKFLSSKRFSDIMPAEFEEQVEITKKVLAAIGIKDPEDLITQEKRELFTWLVKASSGKDSIGRDNYLITINAIKAALRRATLREEAIKSPIVGKFFIIWKALEFVRDYYRTNMDWVAGELGSMVSEVAVFEQSGVTATLFDKASLVSRLERIEYFLEQVHLAPYLWPAAQAKKELADIREKLLSDGKLTPPQVKRIGELQQRIIKTLKDNEDLSPHNGNGA